VPGLIHCVDFGNNFLPSSFENHIHSTLQSRNVQNPLPRRRPAFPPTRGPQFKRSHPPFFPSRADDEDSFPLFFPPIIADPFFASQSSLIIVEVGEHGTPVRETEWLPASSISLFWRGACACFRTISSRYRRAPQHSCRACGPRSALCRLTLCFVFFAAIFETFFPPFFARDAEIRLVFFSLPCREQQLELTCRQGLDLQYFPPFRRSPSCPLSLPRTTV